MPFADTGRHEDSEDCQQGRARANFTRFMSAALYYDRNSLTDEFWRFEAALAAEYGSFVVDRNAAEAMMYGTAFVKVTEDGMERVDPAEVYANAPAPKDSPLIEALRKQREKDGF